MVVLQAVQDGRQKRPSIPVSGYNFFDVSHTMIILISNYGFSSSRNPLKPVIHSLDDCMTGKPRWPQKTAVDSFK